MGVKFGSHLNRLIPAIAGGGFFAFAVVTGVWLAHSSWGGVIFLADHAAHDRNPAAVPKKISNAWHLSRSQDELVKNAQIVLNDGTPGVELGHFLARDREGQGRLACDIYDHVVIQFEADGIAEDGEKPTMKVEGPCLMSEDGSSIKPLWIPTEKIQREHATDMDLKYEDQAATSYTFSKMTDSWPKRWRMVSVRLFSESGEATGVDYSGTVLNQQLRQPIYLNW